MMDDCPILEDLSDLSEDIRLAGEDLRERLRACRRCREREACDERREFVDNLRQAVRELAAELRRAGAATWDVGDGPRG